MLYSIIVLDHFTCKLLSSTIVLNVIFLLQALCGTILEVPTMSGEKLTVNLQGEVVKPYTVKRFPGYGLPFPKEPTRKGDLLVAFDIKFPDRLTSGVKEILMDTLPN